MMREDVENPMVIDELWHDDEYDYYLREDPYRGYDDWAESVVFWAITTENKKRATRREELST